MRKLLFSLAAILVLLVLVSCPDGMIPTSILDIALTMSEDSEIKLEQFEKLNYTVKEVESGKEITQEFSTIENIKVPVVTTGEYVISVTGVTEDDNYTYTCSGSETVTVTENQATKVEIILKTTKDIKNATISLSFEDKIEKSDEYDLNIAKISYVVTAAEKEIAKGELKTSESNSISLTISKEVNELNYTLTAYNATGVEIGYGKGTITVENGVEKYSASVLEKEGEGKLTVTITKHKGNEFPVVKIKEKEYPIDSESSETVGSVSLSLTNGIYSVVCGEEKEEVRIVAGQTKVLNFNFATDYIPVSFTDNIEKSEEYNLNVATIDYTFPGLESEYSAKGVEFKEDLIISIPKVIGEVKYNVVAYNNEGVVIGEKVGSLIIDTNSEKSSIAIEEKEGEGTIVFNLKKDSFDDFPEIKVGDKVVEIKISEDKTSGTGSITLKNGVYDIYEKGTVKESVRIVQGMEKAISYDYSRRWIDFRFYVDVDQENTKGLNLELDHYHYIVKSLTNGFVHNDTEEKKIMGVGFLEDDYEYLFEAVNSDGVAFAEAKGKVLASEYIEPINVVMKEKAGDGYLLVKCVKNSSDDFPVLTVGDKEYRFEESSKTEGSVTITLLNGLYTVVCNGKEQIVRIAVDQTNTINYDFSFTPMPVEVIDSIPKYDGYDMEIAKVSYYFEKDGEVIKSDDATFDEFKALTFKKTGKDVWNYEVKAYNEAGVQIGEASGRYLFAYQKDSFEIELKEKIGEATIQIDIIRPLDIPFPEITINDEKIEEDSFEIYEYREGINKYSYTSDRKSGEYVISIGNTVKTVQVVNGINRVLSADYSTGIDVDIKNEVSASGDYTIRCNNDSYRFEVVIGGESLGEGISVKWILNGTEQESRESVTTFGVDELESGSYVLYSYIYDGNKLLDIASILFTIESM